MKISSSQLMLQAQSSSLQRQEVAVRLSWRDRPGLQDGGTRTASPAPASPSAAAQSTQLTPTDEEARTLTPGLQLLKRLLERVLGRSIDLVDLRQIETPEATAVPTQAPAPLSGESSATAAAGGLGGTLTVRTMTMEHLSFSASGRVQTTDGRSIEFSLGFALTRATASEVQAVFGSAVQDPLVLDFACTGAELRDLGFRFDLSGEGSEVNLPLPTSGKGFLVFDRNGNGRVDDGRELFGPSTGDGFGELAALDADGNGWIDQNDPAWSQLYVWHPYRRDVLIALPEADVGAIGLVRAATPLTVTDEGGQALGALRSTGIYLRESGSVGTISHLDVKA